MCVIITNIYQYLKEETNMWDKSTSIYEPEVVAIKNAILEKGLADASAFEINKNFDISSGATHYPVVFIVDVSSSLREERVYNHCF